MARETMKGCSERVRRRRTGALAREADVGLGSEGRVTMSGCDPPRDEWRRARGGAGDGGGVVGSVVSPRGDGGRVKSADCPLSSRHVTVRAF